MKKDLALLFSAVACLAGVACTPAQNLIVNGDLSAGNLLGWTITPNAPITITYDAGTGNPAGAAFLARNDSTAAANGNHLHQIIPVANGAQYKLSAQSKGDLLNGGTGRNWAEVYINFTDTDTTFVPGTIRYRKATDGGPNPTPMPCGWIEMKSEPVPVDTDNDGMSDEWETRYGLDPKDASDAAKDKDGDVYTNIEEHFNGTDPTRFVDYTKPENNVSTLKYESLHK